MSIEAMKAHDWQLVPVRWQERSAEVRRDEAEAWKPGSESVGGAWA